MSNWCCQNSKLRGPKEDIKRFCDTVNACLTSAEAPVDGYGKYGLANLCRAFGYDYEKVDRAGGHLRGNIDPNGERFPTMCHPKPELIQFVPVDIDEKTAFIDFTITSAWGPSPWFNDMIEEKFPNCEYGWYATDEYGNFHYVTNREVIGIPLYDLNYPDYASLNGRKPEPMENVPFIDAGFNAGEEDKAAALFNSILELTKKKKRKISAEDVKNDSDYLRKQIYLWNEKHYCNMVYRVWDEED